MRLRYALACVVWLIAVPAFAGDTIADGWVPADGDAGTHALRGVYTGFGAETSGGEGRPVLTVTALADSGLGSLREVLATTARLGGGRVVFAVGGDVVLRAPLAVPANTTIDGLSAPPPGITLWGDSTGSDGGGVLEIQADDVIVRGLRIRNALNDGIQIAAKRGTSIARIVVDHCSITNSGDGGIDVTGHDGAIVSDVTLSWNYLAGNGGPCAKVWCGGGSLVKYGVTRISVHANVWDKNLRRNPSIDGAAVDGGTLADLRGNVVRGYVESGMQLRDGARGNVVGNFFFGARPLLTNGAVVFAAANDGAAAPSTTQPFDVPAALGPLDVETVLASAGAPARDAIDTLYRETLTTYEAVKTAAVAPDNGNDLPLALPGADPRAQAVAELRLALRARRDHLSALRHARAAALQAHVAADRDLERRARRLLRQLERVLRIEVVPGS